MKHILEFYYKTPSGGCAGGDSVYICTRCGIATEDYPNRSTCWGKPEKGSAEEERLKAFLKKKAEHEEWIKKNYPSVANEDSHIRNQIEKGKEQTP